VVSCAVCDAAARRPASERPAFQTSSGLPSASARPLCPYPQTAHYTGSGSLDDAANFACRD
jgi:feruloyl esterase